MNTNIYARLTEKRQDSDELKKCMEDTVRELMSKETDVEHPGMLLGDIQSGKTRAFIGIIALGFDRKYSLTVILTKGTKALVKQTVQRLKNEFHEFEEEDLLRVYDVMEMPSDLNEYIIERQKLILVVKKEDDNINRLKRVFFETYPNLKEKDVLIIDDEADFVSIGYRNKKNETGEKTIDLNVISKQISDFRKSLPKGSDYLQVTATPYSLYLQPENIVINDTLFAPLRPKFTILLPIHEKYIGSNYYFEESKKPDSPAKFLFQAINEDELKTLSKTHGKILDNVLLSPAISCFRSAVINYVVASCIRIIQSERKGINYKSSFIIHTETSKIKHENQVNLINNIVSALKIEGGMKSEFLRLKLAESYLDFKLSISLTDFYMPSFEEVFDKACEYIRFITIRKINSDNEVINLLKISTGELLLESPLNIFVGGQIIDRGITIQNLIGFFYGRNPKRMQQDTVMQHARIFGARTLEDMAVTRLYTTNRIYEALRRMHESDKALRKAFEEGGIHQKVAFIQKGSDGKIIPCNPNKILISNTVTLRPSGTLPIYGFLTKAKTNILKTIDQISERLRILSRNQIEKPFIIDINEAKDLLERIFGTFEEQYPSFGCTKEEFFSSIEYLSTQTEKKDLYGKLYCFSNLKPKNSSRFKENQRGKMFNDVCYDGKTDSKLAKDVAIEIPCLFLSFQDGKKEKDWRDAQFYWPVLFIQNKLVTSIFTTDLGPEIDFNDDEDDEDLTGDTGPMFNPTR